jgi:hypothetical protein
MTAGSGSEDTCNRRGMFMLDLLNVQYPKEYPPSRLAFSVGMALAPIVLL